MPGQYLLPQRTTSRLHPVTYDQHNEPEFSLSATQAVAAGPPADDASESLLVTYWEHSLQANRGKRILEGNGKSAQRLPRP